MKGLGKIFFGAGTWPSIGIYWGLVLGAQLSISRAALFAILYAVVYTLIAIGANRVTKLDYGVVLFWAVGLGVRFSGSSLNQVYLIRNFSTFLYIALFLMAYLPVVFGAEPFTIAFAKRRTPDVYWKTDEFQNINRIMTMVWAGLFLVAMLITLIPGLWTQILIPFVFLMVAGIPFNSKFPDIYLKHKGLGGLSAAQKSAATQITLPAGPLESPEAALDAPDDEERKEISRSLGPVKDALVVFGSPRGERGFTFKALDRFLDGIREGGIKPEVLFLNKYEIRPCIGCYTCWTKTPGVCIHKDDMPELMKKVNDADLVIYAQPLYVFSVPGITKNFLDRQLPLLEPFLVERPNGSTGHPRRWEGDTSGRMLLFSVCGFPEIDHFEALIQMFRLMSQAGGTPIVGEILRPSSESMRFGDRMGRRYEGVMDALFGAGREIVSQGFVSRATEQAIAQPLLPDIRGFRHIANQYWNTLINYEAERKAGHEMPEWKEYLVRDMGMFFGGMAASYDPTRADDFEGTFQFSIVGDRQGKYYLEIKDHQCTSGEGEAAKPDLIISTPWDVWLSISRGEMSGQEAFMKGMYKVDGDIGLLLKMQEMFSG